MTETFLNICNFLNEHKIEYKHVQHAPTFTSEESALARGESIEIGAKALCLKTDDCFSLFVLSAALKTDSKKIKKLTNSASIRFATPDELFEMTKLVPGCVPPFGEPILPFKLYVDESIVYLEKIAFNAGLLTDSLILKTKDYLKICNGQISCFSK